MNLIFQKEFFKQRPSFLGNEILSGKLSTQFSKFKRFDALVVVAARKQCDQILRNFAT